MYLRITRRFVIMAGISLSMLAPGYTQGFGIKGQAIGWTTISKMDQWRGQAGLRYIPELTFKTPVQKDFSFDAKASLNAYGSGLYWSSDSIIWDGRIKPYRMWARFSGDRFEIRAGLQKINFGSATMLRPLMWFDQIDPRDPLQLTDGVYGILGRYYFMNNANIWIWALYGNDQLKGWEFIPSVKTVPEFGGRFQFPVPRGEMGTSFHYREADVEKFTQVPPGEDGQIREKRLGLDGKFDLGVGLWFEGVLVNKEIHIPELEYTSLLNLGIDYTFGAGNGLNLMIENFSIMTSDRNFGNKNSNTFSALSAMYPVSIISNLNGILFYDWKNQDVYNFINWSWTFDQWSFYLMGFWNPDRFNIYQSIEGANLYAGKGLQIMIVYNH